MPLRPTQYNRLAPLQERTSRYGGFRGVDYVSDPQLVDDTRSPEAVNLMTDAGGYPEKRPGWRVIRKLEAPINGLHRYADASGNQFILAHCKNKLYKIAADSEMGETSTVLVDNLNDAKSTSFTHGGKLYLMDGASYRVFDGTDLLSVPPIAYAPTTVIGRAPEGGGTPLEPVNMLTARRKNSFVGDGGTKEVVQLEIYNGPKAAGSCWVKLDGADTEITGLVADANSITVAYRIMETKRDGGFPDWSLVRIGDSITFTRNTVGACGLSNFTAGDANVLAGLVVLTPGKDPAKTLQLDATNIDEATVTMSVTVDGTTTTKTEGTHFKVNRTTGVISLDTEEVPSPMGYTPEGHGVDNIVVSFAKTLYEKDADGNNTSTLVSERIKKCTIAAWFGQGNDTRVFVSGNPNFKNWDWQSGLYDPTYFPDTGYTKVGADATAIKGYLRQFTSMLIVKEDNGQDATIYQRTAEMDGNSKPYFPLKQGVEGVGAISSHTFATLCDTPLFLAKEGVFSLTMNYGGVDQQRIAQNRSYFVNPKLVREANLRDAAACVWDGLYLLAVNDRCYVADGRKQTGMSRTEDRSYEWFFWNNIPARVWLVLDDICYFGTADGRICRFNTGMEHLDRYNDEGTYAPISLAYNHDGKAVPAMWATKVDDDGDFMRYKNLPRRGSGLLIKPFSRSSVDVFVVNDENQKTLSTSDWSAIFTFDDIDFERFSFVTSKNPIVVPLSSPIRHYKTLQIIARNINPSEGFGLFGIIKRFTVSDYVR